MILTMDMIDLERWTKEWPQVTEGLLQRAVQFSGDEEDQKAKNRYGNKSYWEARRAYDLSASLMDMSERLATLRFFARTFYHNPYYKP